MLVEKMSEVLLSVIVPIFNGRKFLRKTMDSLLDIHCLKEILLIDDGSTDGSFEFCKNIFGGIKTSEFSL